MHLFHRWVTKYGFDSIAVYQECAGCHKRRYIQYEADDPVLPVNQHWLKTGEIYTPEERACFTPRPPHDPFAFGDW